jgi:hypothetical protein
MGLIGHFSFFLSDLGPVSIGHYPPEAPRESQNGYPGEQGNPNVKVFDTRSHLSRAVPGLI